MNRVAVFSAVAAAVTLIGIIAPHLDTSAQAQSSAPVIHEHFKAMPCPKDPVSTPEQEGCIEHRLLASDKRIDKLDAELFADLGSSSLQKRFIAGHDAWLNYRRTDCGNLWASLEEGTVYPIVVGNCELARNRQRIKDLREVLAYPEKP